MLDLYLNRRFDDPPMRSKTLIPLSEMWLLESDLVQKHRKVRVRLEYDFKRQPISPHMMPVLNGEHLAFDSRPWHTIEQFKKTRAIFDGFRRSADLKTMDDWHEWDDYFKTKLVVKGCGMNINKKGSVDILRRVFLRAICRGTWGLVKNKTNNEIAEWLTIAGYETNADELKNAKRAKLVEHIVPATNKVIELLKILYAEYPDMDISMLFRPKDIDEVLAKLK